MRAAPMAVTADATVRARIERVSAAAQVRIDITAEVASPGRWLLAPLVLLDAADIEILASAGLPKRERVVVLANQPMTSAQWQACVSLGVSQVVTADGSDYDVVQLLTEVTDEPSPSAPGRIIAVIGACGGVGGSVFSAAVALAATGRVGRAVLVDADPDGAGLDVLLGMESVRGARWGDIATSHGRIPDGALWQALPAIPGSRSVVALLGFGPDRAASADIGALDAVLDAVRRGGDSAVVDVPRRRGSPVDRVVARADVTVVVVPAEVRGCYAAARLIPRLADLGATLGVVVRGPSPGGIGPGDIADALSVPLIAAMRPQPGLARLIDGGAGLGGRLHGPLRKAAVATVNYVVRER